MVDGPNRYAVFNRHSESFYVWQDYDVIDYGHYCKFKDCDLYSMEDSLGFYSGFCVLSDGHIVLISCQGEMELYEFIDSALSYSSEWSTSLPEYLFEFA